MNDRLPLTARLGCDISFITPIMNGHLDEGWQATCRCGAHIEGRNLEQTRQAIRDHLKPKAVAS